VFILYYFFLEIKWKNLNIITLFSLAMMRVETMLAAAMILAVVTMPATEMILAVVTMPAVEMILATVKKAESKYSSPFTCF
jgi:hypothetical protein